MGYVVYEVESTKLVSNKQYLTRSAAKAAKTRHINKEYKRTGCPLLDGCYEVAGVADYYANIERKVTRVNLMSGNEYQESVNTPNYCSPASEAYWSM